ncbi:MAG: ComEC/Rec2 family competence protein, partial [Candidatus Eremiobacteraeota bacterium]|nr:ComEC/Rec2 family competence protein [Candidatus Eremiobacteraeota bacterium]
MPPYALLWIAGATVLGVLIASPLSFADRTIVATALAVGGAGLSRFPHETRQLRALAAAALVCAALYAYAREASTPSVIPTRTARFTADVTDERAADGDVRTYVLAIGDRLRVLASFNREVPLGARILVRGRLEPLDEARNPGEPSERAVEAEHGITGRLASAALLEILDPRSDSLTARLARLHATALTLLRKHLAEPGASIVAGELWGDRSALPPDLRSEFQETGTVHVLVTAGLHVGLIAWLVATLCARLTVPRVWACVAAIVVVWLFAYFSGSNLPAIRAASMATAMLTARAFGRATLSWNSLALAAIVVGLILPSSLATPSFWLSFCCVGAIFVCVPALEPIIDRFSLHERVREALLLTLATQLGTWPITAATFLQFSPYALIANVAVVPLVPLTMILGMAQLIATPFSSLAQACANLNSWLLAWMVGAVHILATLPGAAIRMTPAPTWCIAVYEGALIVSAILGARRAWNA